MSTATLERMPGIVSTLKRCDLKKIADKDVAYHPEKRILLANWEVCIRCNGYDMRCPGYQTTNQSE